jgi:RNA polymerase-binding transcription factor DksA
MHLGDMGTDEYLHDLNSTLLENEEYIAAESLEALHRMDAGRFGICESCEKPIAEERLEAIPYARFCVACAASQSSRAINVNAGRPNGPEETLAPEGEMDEDRPRRRQGTIADRARERGRGDIHAAGTAGGGTSMGGLAGMNAGRGDPQIAALQEATASGDFDAHEPDDEDELTPHADARGGAKEGTTGTKRFRRESP